jgi:hypothetical protein
MTPALPPLTFDAITHAYHVAGAPVPHVTGVLEAAGLLNYAFLGDQREVYLSRGRAVHKITEADDHGNLAEDAVPPTIRGFVEAWGAFKRDYGFVPALIEHRVLNEQHRYAGTLDRTGRVRDGSTWILDLKTGAAPAAVCYQLAAYAACLQHPRTYLRRCVELHEDASYRVLAYETADYQRDFDRFLSALSVFRTGSKQ